MPIDSRTCLVIEPDAARRRRLVAALQHSRLFSAVSSQSHPRSAATEPGRGYRELIIFISDLLSEDELSVVLSQTSAMAKFERPALVQVTSSSSADSQLENALGSIHEPFEEQKFSRIIEASVSSRVTQVTQSFIARLEFLVPELPRLIDELSYSYKRGLPTQAAKANLERLRLKLREFTLPELECYATNLADYLDYRSQRRDTQVAPQVTEPPHPTKRAHS